ncbi:hypothetical protein POTOM_017023 [Populus tomentosa]|uniref:non-specific serine/threonine protein kinase n=1 Tax=Populus tomentosa TaxID=118781 RepID=A0A8X7ZY45_POPTO|nr:hypothetical protein POTOM_017023 [Populus tomentosa]
MGWLGGKGKSHSEGENVHCLESVLTLDLPKFVTPPVYKIFFLVRPEELKLRLNWPARFKICLGIARGLAFLHEESKLKIVHRDIEPTNVIPNKDLNAKISDFGLAKLYEAEHTLVITRIAGTTFGVVALEIVSGKNGSRYRPNDESASLLDLAYVLQEKGEFIYLIDPVLGYDYSVKQEMIILDLAMLCTDPSPPLRPAMSEVVKILGQFYRKVIKCCFL